MRKEGKDKGELAAGTDEGDHSENDRDKSAAKKYVAKDSDGSNSSQVEDNERILRDSRLIRKAQHQAGCCQVDSQTTLCISPLSAIDPCMATLPKSSNPLEARVQAVVSRTRKGALLHGHGPIE